MGVSGQGLERIPRGASVPNVRVNAAKCSLGELVPRASLGRGTIVGYDIRDIGCQLDGVGKDTWSGGGEGHCCGEESHERAHGDLSEVLL